MVACDPGLWPSQVFLSSSYLGDTGWQRGRGLELGIALPPCYHVRLWLSLLSLSLFLSLLVRIPLFMGNALCIFYNGYFLPSHARARKESFLILYEDLVGFLEVKFTPPGISHFQAGSYSTFSSLSNLSFKCFYHLLALMVSALGKQIWVMTLWIYFSLQISG